MDSLYWGPIRVSQLLAAISCFAAVVLLMVLAFRKHDPEKLFVNVQAKKAALAEEAEEGEAEIEEEPEAKTEEEQTEE